MINKVQAESLYFGMRKGFQIGIMTCLRNKYGKPPDFTTDAVPHAAYRCVVHTLTSATQFPTSSPKSFLQNDWPHPLRSMAILSVLSEILATLWGTVRFSQIHVYADSLR